MSEETREEDLIAAFARQQREASDVPDVTVACNRRLAAELAPVIARWLGDEVAERNTPPSVVVSVLGHALVRALLSTVCTLAAGDPKRVRAILRRFQPHFFRVFRASSKETLRMLREKRDEGQ